MEQIGVKLDGKSGILYTLIFHDFLGGGMQVDNRIGK